MSAKKSKSFEQTLQNLEKVVSELESGELSLEDQLKAFEKGVAFSRECLTKLDDVEKRVEKLVSNEKGLEAQAFEATPE